MYTGSDACLKPALFLPSWKFRRRVEVRSFQELHCVITLRPVEVLDRVEEIFTRT